MVGLDGRDGEEALMRALIYDGHVRLKENWPDPHPGRDEALVAVHKAGICATDLEVARGYMGFRGVMGHEFVGEVAAGPRRWKGHRVVGEINCVCGRCRMCRGGLANHCLRRTVLGISGRDGCFAEFLAVPLRNLHEVPDSVSDEAATFVEPLAAALQIVRQVKLGSRDSVVVLGDGRLGQLIARVLKGRRLGKLVMVGRHAAKLEAAEKQGVQAVAAEDFVAAQDADVVVDATGRSAGLELAMRAVRPRGTIVLKSTYAKGDGINLSPLVVNEITLMGSRCGPFEDAIAALASREVDVATLVSAEFPLSEGTAALAAAGEGDKFKVLLDARR
jgi:threonine dehydrogenase-like Zn-dependent dehydrogenase